MKQSTLLKVAKRAYFDYYIKQKIEFIAKDMVIYITMHTMLVMPH